MKQPTKYILTLFLVSLSFALRASAQQTVSGSVLDAASGAPVAGARIVAHGQNRYATMTGDDGSFQLEVPDFVTMIDVTAPGYNRLQQAVLAGKAMELKLYSEAFADDYQETVATATAHAAADFSLSSALSADDEIVSRLGADVRAVPRSGSPAMGAAMFIGGLGSLHANAMPLVIVDGVYMDQMYGRETVHDGFFNNLLANVSVGDIERITVLKNGASIYGARGSNGVILIDTKRSTSMATRIEVNAMAGVEMVPQLGSMMSASDYRLYASELIGSIDTKMTSFRFLKDDPDYYYYKKYHNETNWSDYLYREALTQNYNISVQGGDEVADYNLSLGYVNGQSTLKCNDFTRLNLRFNTDIHLGSRLSTRFDVAYNFNTRDLRNDGTPEDFTTSTVISPSFLGYIKSPFLHPYRYDEKGHLTTFVEDADDFAQGLALNSSWANPVAINEYGEARNKNWQESSMFNIAIAPRLEIAKHLYAITLFSYSLFNISERSFVPMTGVPVFYISGVGESNNQAASMTSKQESLFSDTKVHWSWSDGGHALQLLGGFRFTSDAYGDKWQEGHNTGNDKTPNLTNSLSFKDTDGIDDVWKSFSYYVQGDYGYRSKYFLQGALSMESSSRFGREAEGLKLAGLIWNVYPSIQAGWLLSNEAFFASHAPFVNRLKLNVGFDVTGNDDIAVTASQTNWTSGKYLNNAIGLYLNNIGNNTIRPETTRRLSAGLDLMAFQNRVGVSAHFFRSSTIDLLTLKSLPEISGEGEYWSNGGSLANRGYDVSLSGKLVNTRRWHWQAGLSAGHYRNEITALPEGDFTTPYCGAEILTAVGQPAGVFYGYKTEGVFATAGQAAAAGLYQKLSTGAKSYFSAGDMIFSDLKEDGCIDENDKTVIGDPNPDVYGNLFTKVDYRRFSLDVAFSYSLGNDIYNYQRSVLESGSSFFNQTTALNRRWVAEGQQTDIPRAAFDDPMGNGRFSDRWIEDGSFLRLKRVTLSYRLPVTTLWMQGLTVWVSGSDLCTFTHYLGADPENSCSNKVLYQGIDCGLVPQSPSVLFGVKLNL